MNRVLIATPLDGLPSCAWVAYGYHLKVRELERQGAVVLPPQIAFTDADLPRARSICANYALRMVPDWDWILWWDCDVVPPDISVVPRMLEACQAEGSHVMCAPYPRKRQPAAFTYRLNEASLEAGGVQASENQCFAVESVPFGFTLTSRRCLEDMTAAYLDETWVTHELGRVPCLFMQVLLARELPDGRVHRELLSEDYSFCHRWRALGHEVHVFAGAGIPLAHVGLHAFQGAREDLANVAR